MIKFAYGVSSLALAFVLSSPALAQTAPAPTAPADTSTPGSAGVGDIIVTATKRAESAPVDHRSVW